GIATPTMRLRTKFDGLQLGRVRRSAPLNITNRGMHGRARESNPWAHHQMSIGVEAKCATGPAETWSTITAATVITRIRSGQNSRSGFAAIVEGICCPATSGSYGYKYWWHSRLGAVNMTRDVSDPV